jgi:hypothetical protein
MNDVPPDERSDAELLRALRVSAKEELEFFSNNRKEARERWVVGQFLGRIPIAFKAEELESLPQQSKKDVRFRDAGFQVKEILNPGTKRGSEGKVAYERLMAAKGLAEVLGPPFTYDVPPPTTMYALVSEATATLATQPRYANVKAEIDLLFYFTRTRASHIRRDEIDMKYLASLGWRSISCLAGERATVLFAHQHAPAFLRGPNGG